jgi:hypothetical protein
VVRIGGSGEWVEEAGNRWQTGIGIGGMAKRRARHERLTESRLTADDMVHERWQVGIGITGLIGMEGSVRMGASSD